MQPVRLPRRQRRKIKELAWRIVSQHIIYLPVVCREALFAEGVFLVRGHLLRPPVEPRLPLLPVGAFGPAETEVFFLFQRQHTAPADVVDIAAQGLHLAAEQLFFRVLGQQVVVFMRAVQKQQGVGPLAQPVQLFLLLFAAVPHKPEIAQHDHHVPLAQPAELAVLEALDIAVGISRQIYHRFPPALCETRKNPCLRRANLLLL